MYRTVEILNKKFHIYDMDEFTKQFYRYTFSNIVLRDRPARLKVHKRENL
jgi:hypothetical protein